MKPRPARELATWYHDGTAYDSGALGQRAKQTQNKMQANLANILHTSQPMEVTDQVNIYRRRTPGTQTRVQMQGRDSPRLRSSEKDICDGGSTRQPSWRLGCKTA